MKIYVKKRVYELYPKDERLELGANQSSTVSESAWLCGAPTFATVGVEHTLALTLIEDDDSEWLHNHFRKCFLKNKSIALTIQLEEDLEVRGTIFISATDLLVNDAIRYEAVFSKKPEIIDWKKI
jgi:hypothetical protein